MMITDPIHDGTPLTPAGPLIDPRSSRDRCPIHRYGDGWKRLFWEWVPPTGRVASGHPRKIAIDSPFKMLISEAPVEGSGTDGSPNQFHGTNNQGVPGYWMRMGRLSNVARPPLSQPLSHLQQTPCNVATTGRGSRHFKCTPVRGARAVGSGSVRSGEGRA